MSQQPEWDPHDELEGKGCAYGWRNRQFIEGLVRDFRIFMAVAALLLTALVALGLLAVSEARSAQTSVAALQVDGAKQQATMESVVPRLDRMESKLDQALDGRIGR